MPGMTYGIIVLVCAIIAAKWAMDLGLSQVRQWIWAAIALFLGPLALLLLYVRLTRDASVRQQAQSKAALEA